MAQAFAQKYGKFVPKQTAAMPPPPQRPRAGGGEQGAFSGLPPVASNPVRLRDEQRGGGASGAPEAKRAKQR